MSCLPGPSRPRSVYEVVGLDRDRWTIVGFDFSLADSEDHVVAYAVDRASTSSTGPWEDGHLLVTAFHLRTSVLHKFLKEVFNRGIGQAAGHPSK